MFNYHHVSNVNKFNNKGKRTAQYQRLVIMINHAPYGIHILISFLTNIKTTCAWNHVDPPPLSCPNNNSAYLTSHNYNNMFINIENM